ncbi:hypothetical protein [Paenibacillus azoreducens]|uniref:Uncharacterized protein n=1 Tax=Paenibacillus azoreducens TaxID=116718 RepID=A0A919YHR6_9BACL|nr:hypothetical protein [Paenibacillus azoreducens]GIO51437.1 hypothetical protein J34TS1_62020 [Paenibacillus azoreducens]
MSDIRGRERIREVTLENGERVFLGSNKGGIARQYLDDSGDSVTMMLLPHLTTS